MLIAGENIEKKKKWEEKMASRMGNVVDRYGAVEGKEWKKRKEGKKEGKK
jgi:hypothetical protein